jgi:phosphoglycolate phosphatase-like HAD superfamily hydrolase
VPRDREHAAAVAEFERRKVALLAHLTPTEGTLRALAGLRDAGCRLAVSSNARQVLVDRFVRRCGLAFDVALGWSHGLQKGRSHFHEICRRTACTIDSLLFVGDSIVDGRLAADAGVSFAARLGTFTSDQFRASWPDVACVTELEELLPWIEQRMPVRRAPMRLAPGR